jgi:hypothetical protein
VGFTVKDIVESRRKGNVEIRISAPEKIIAP